MLIEFTNLNDVEKFFEEDRIVFESKAVPRQNENVEINGISYIVKSIIWLYGVKHGSPEVVIRLQ